MISPPVREAFNKHHRLKYITKLALFVVSATVSGSVVGGISGIVGSWITPPFFSLQHSIIVFVVATSLIYGAAELLGIKLWVPTRHWEVPKQWSFYGSLFYAAIFGATLGIGFFTFITFVGYYLLLLSCILAADPVYGSIVMAIYGLSRAIPVSIAPLILWVQQQPYTLQETVNLNQWIARSDRQFRFVRALSLFLLAVSMLK